MLNVWHFFTCYLCGWRKLARSSKKAIEIHDRERPKCIGTPVID